MVKTFDIAKLVTSIVKSHQRYQKMGSLTFSRYHIASSHNTYLDGQQLFTCGSKKSVTQTLQEGARMIELDLFFDSASKRIKISHGRNISPTFNLLCSTPLSLEDVCDKIADFVTPNTSPIFLMLEVNIGRELERQNILADLLVSRIGQFLVPGNVDLRMAFPDHYLGKILLAVNGGLNASSRLNAMINVKFATENYLMNRSHGSILNDRTYYRDLFIAGNVVRSYPSNTYLSKNFDPLPLFELGVQFVSMNYQTRDPHMKAYKKMFDYTQFIGYRPM